MSHYAQISSPSTDKSSPRPKTATKMAMDPTMYVHFDSVILFLLLDVITLSPYLYYSLWILILPCTKAMIGRRVWSQSLKSLSLVVTSKAQF